MAFITIFAIALFTHMTFGPEGLFFVFPLTMLSFPSQISSHMNLLNFGVPTFSEAIVEVPPPPPPKTVDYKIEHIDPEEEIEEFEMDENDFDLATWEVLN